jgi:MFS superfamily sulfate permease-like transporter
MLAGIGVIIILKQIPMLLVMMLILKEISLLFKVMVAIFSSLFEVFNHIQLGSVSTVVSLIILIAWDKVPFKEIKINSRCINSSNFRHCAE